VPVLAILTALLVPAVLFAQGLPPAGVLVNIHTVDKDTGFFVPAFLRIRMEYPSQEKPEEFSVRIFHAHQDVRLVMPPKEKNAIAHLEVSAPGYACEEELVIAPKRYWESVDKAGDSKKRPLLTRKTFRLKRARG